MAESITSVCGLQERLSAYDCLYTWDLEQFKNDSQRELHVAQVVAEKDEEMAHDLWRSIIFQLLLSYETSVEGRWHESWEHLRGCETILKSAPQGSIVQRYTQALVSVLSVTKLFVFLHTSGGVSHNEKYFESAVLTSELPTDQQSAVWALRAVVCQEYGMQGSKAALEFSRHALELNNAETEWHFMVGKCMGRVRHMSNTRQPPDLEEIKQLRIAYHQDGTSPRYAVYLATSIHEQAISLFLRMTDKRREMNTNVGQVLKDSYYEALKLYFKAIELNQDKCLHVMMRCARGLMLLPLNYKDLKTTEELNNKCFDRSPTSIMSNHNIAIFHLIRKERDKALKYLLKASALGCYGASIAALEVVVQLDKTASFNPASTYQKILQDYPEDECRLQTSLHAVTYYILICRDVIQAIEHFLRAVNIDPNHPSIRGFKIQWMKLDKLLDVYDLVGNEVRCAIKLNNYSSPEELKQLRSVIVKLHTIAPEVMSEEPNPGLIEELCKNSTRLETEWLKRREKLLKRRKRCGKKTITKEGQKSTKSEMGNRPRKERREWERVRLSRQSSRGRLSDSEESEASEKLWRPIKKWWRKEATSDSDTPHISRQSNGNGTNWRPGDCKYNRNKKSDLDTSDEGESQMKRQGWRLAVKDYTDSPADNVTNRQDTLSRKFNNLRIQKDNVTDSDGSSRSREEVHNYRANRPKLVNWRNKYGSDSDEPSTFFRFPEVEFKRRNEFTSKRNDWSTQSGSESDIGGRKDSKDWTNSRDFQNRRKAFLFENENPPEGNSKKMGFVGSEANKTSYCRKDNESAERNMTTSSSKKISAVQSTRNAASHEMRKYWFEDRRFQTDVDLVTNQMSHQLHISSKRQTPSGRSSSGNSCDNSDGGTKKSRANAAKDGGSKSFASILKKK